MIHYIYNSKGGIMHISNIQNTIYIGQIKISSNKYNGKKHVLYDHKLQVNYSKSLPKGFKNKHMAIIYFFVVDGEIYKIGQTSGTSGIQGCMSFYCSAGQDDPGQSRFAINYLVREQLKQNKKVEIYIKTIPQVTMMVEGLFGNQVTITTPPSAKEVESACLADYFSRTGSHPVWNFQESGRAYPAHIKESFGAYVKKRGKTFNNIQ
jgi:hypothetical protein